MTANVEIITTTQAPDAKPIGLSYSVLDDWDPLITVPSYEIPELVFGGETVIVPGVAEVISPMLLSNKTASTETVSLRIFRTDANTYFTVVNELPIPANDILALPLNGQFIYTGDVLEIKASALNSVDMTISYTVGQAETDDVS